MKKIWKKLIGVVFVFFAIILIYSSFRTLIDKTNLLISFDKTFSLVVQEIWKFISTPAIFITLVILVVCLNFRDQINNIFPKIKELSYKGLSIAFDSRDRKRFESTQGTYPNNDDQIKSIISAFGKRTTAVLLELGDKILDVDEIVKIIKKNSLLECDFVTNKKPSLSKGYYYGVFKSLQFYFFDYLFDDEVSEDKMQAKLNYKPKVQALLEKRNRELKNPEEK